MTRVKIYVNLLDEGIDVQRPVWAEYCGKNEYRILDEDYNPTVETWEFKPGEIVECIQRSADGKEKYLLAKWKVGEKKE